MVYRYNNKDKNNDIAMYKVPNDVSLEVTIL